MDFLTSALYLLFALTSIRALFSFLRGTKKCPKLPPGPVPLPVIGNLLKLGDKPNQSLAELAKTHGPIMSLKLGRVTVVVISSSAMAKEVLQKQDLAFSNRSIPNALHAHEQYKYSVVWLPVSNRWRSLRKILNSNIFSSNRLDATQELRRRKVAELVEYAQNCSQEGVAVNIGRAGFRTSMNVLSNTIFSEDLADPREDMGKEFKELVWNIMVEAGKPNLVDFFPRVAKMDPQGITRRMTDYFGSVLELFGGLIDRRLQVRRFRKSPEENDVIDILLNRK
ncbi:Geraniol 8-hydroxylase [Camellia lanceoleosa]|uniref:Geraniol 8-hydroxylase n=1 Tax=Camellia lanceoleosa TaxID=1840588 RepID=A0ACC0I9D8_9ERIC|nr:Geraniol 8-hydroxylase [Camellia lanceoleosa]